MLPPLVLGCALVESGLLGKWREVCLERREIMLKKWVVLLTPYAYFSPANQYVLDVVGGSDKAAKTASRPPGPPSTFFASAAAGHHEKRVTLGDVLRERCELKGVSLVPKPGVRENGCQVYRLGPRSVYWSEDRLFAKLDETTEWAEVAVDDVVGR